jgi:transposase
MKRSRQQVEVDLPELYAVLDQARREPLSDPDYQKLKTALGALAGLAIPERATEKTGSVLAEINGTPSSEQKPEEKKSGPKPGHGRNGASAFSGADRRPIRHARLTSGDLCPECEKGKAYAQKEPKVLVRVIGQAPLTATVYELERLRCNACGQVFTAEEPEGIGPEKYDETTAAMIAQLKYGSGVPFNRLEKLQYNLGVPMPATTQWEIVEEAAELLKPALEELIRQAAQGAVLHNDDTSMRACFGWRVNRLINVQVSSPAA